MPTKRSSPRSSRPIPTKQNHEVHLERLHLHRDERCKCRTITCTRETSLTAKDKIKDRISVVLLCDQCEEVFHDVEAEGGSNFEACQRIQERWDHVTKFGTAFYPKSLFSLVDIHGVQHRISLLYVGGPYHYAERKWCVVSADDCPPEDSPPDAPAVRYYV